MFLPINLKNRKRSNIIFPFLLGVIIFIILKTSELKNTKEFPYINISENTVLLVKKTDFENKTIDTLTFIYKKANLWRKITSPTNLYLERNDSLLSQYYFAENCFIEERKDIPFFSLFDKSNQTYTIVKAKKTLGSMWKDENTGLIHKFKGIDTLSVSDNIYICRKIETILSSKAKIMIMKTLKSRKNISETKLKQIERILNSKWIEWYAKDFGWVKSIFPNGDVYQVIDKKNIYWFERISRYFGFGIR